MNTPHGEQTTEDEVKIIYEENWMPIWSPLVFFLPMFYNYGVRIERGSLSNESADIYVTFGYGFRKPSNSGLTAYTIKISDIKEHSILTGTAIWSDNLLSFGGWGIRYGRGRGRGQEHNRRLTWAYNAENGDYIEFLTKKNGSYRFVTRNQAEVALILRQALGAQNAHD